MITTLSGTYTIEQYNAIVERVANAFRLYWQGAIDFKHLERIKKQSQLSYAEIKNIQYDTSIKEMKKLEYLKGVFENE